MFFSPCIELSPRERDFSLLTRRTAKLLLETNNAIVQRERARERGRKNYLCIPLSTPRSVVNPFVSLSRPVRVLVSYTRHAYTPDYVDQSQRFTESPSRGPLDHQLQSPTSLSPPPPSFRTRNFFLVPPSPPSLFPRARSLSQTYIIN